MNRFHYTQTIWLIIALVAALFSGCSKTSPYGPVFRADTPTTAKVRYDADKGGFSNTTLEYNEQVKFRIIEGTLVPPKRLEDQEEVTVTMQVEENEERGELIFTFGPSGTRFEQPAEIELSWRALGEDVTAVAFYYIDEDGTYVPQEPARIDYENQVVRLNVHHFSRYAVAQAR